MKHPVLEKLDERGHGYGEIDDGFDYDSAAAEGALDELDLFQSALPGFSYDEDVLADEDPPPWEPIGWDDD
jgi:hypothetical protein